MKNLVVPKSAKKQKTCYTAKNKVQTHHYGEAPHLQISTEQVLAILLTRCTL